MTAPAVVSVRAGRRTDAVPFTSAAPELSWITESTTASWMQASAEVEVRGEIHRVDGGDSVLVAWPFAPLAPRERAEVRVRVSGTDGSTSDWSKPCGIIGGQLGENEWQAQLVAATESSEYAQPIMLQHSFTVEESLSRAYFYGTAHGVYHAEINGSAVDDAEMKPGWTSYQHRLLYDVAEVTELVRSGENSILVDLAGGWFTEKYGFEGQARAFYGEQPAFAGQLVLEYASGRTEVVATDENWMVTTEGPRRFSSIYHGERVDARRAVPALGGADWTEVHTELLETVPEQRLSEPVRQTQELSVASWSTTPAGKIIVDFGQNLVGRVRFRVSGDSGHVITLRHAEVMENGELGTRPLRLAEATDSYTLRGEEVEEWEPRFTFHGFRYVQIDGWPGDFDPTAVTAVVMHSDMERTGWFDSSHAQLNRLHENVVWGMRGNFFSLPSDCPQRDERLGWTGDIQIFAPTASYLFDCDAFLGSWLTDLAAEQTAMDGVVPFVIPYVLPWTPTPAAAWGDAATVVPMVLHERFGDLDILRQQYASMVAWADTVARLAGPALLWEGHFQFGDWLDPDAPADDPGKAKTDPALVATAHYYRSTVLVAQAAALLGHTVDATEYGDRADSIKAAFQNAFVTPSARLLSDAPTAYALALQFELAPETMRKAMGDRLAHLVRAAGYRMSTGFVGTPLVQDALIATGHAEVAGRLLQQTRNPSWLYSVTMGATTMWERWDSMLEDGSINPGWMTSFNHYAFGAVADWMHRGLGGIAPAAPGYKRIRIAPNPMAGVDWASTSHRTPYGLVEVHWSHSDDAFELTTTIPPNTSAEVLMPDGSRFELGSGTHRLATTIDIAPELAGTKGLDSTLAEIVDDREAFEQLLTVLSAVDPNGEWMGRGTRWVPQRTLREELLMAPADLVGMVQAGLGSVRRRQ